jgi:hypothetical protein
VSNALYDALRAAGVDLLQAHRLDAYLRAIGDDGASTGFVRSLEGDPADVTRLRAALTADLDAITTGLALLDAMA